MSGVEERKRRKEGNRKLIKAKERLELNKEEDRN